MYVVRGCDSMVECQLPMLKVVGSSPIIRLLLAKGDKFFLLFLFDRLKQGQKVPFPKSLHLTTPLNNFKKEGGLGEDRLSKNL